MRSRNMLSATDADKLSLLMPEPIRWYGVPELRTDPTGVFVARKSGERARDATIGGSFGWSTGQKSSMAAGCEFE